MTMADTVAVMNAGRVEQMGPPAELYELPRTAFVANFLGQSNLLAGTVVEQGEVLGVDVAGTRIQVPAARAVSRAARVWGADRVVAEANQGGAMVASVLRAADCALPVKLVHASRGKAARAEPVAALYEAGKVRHAGMFAALEDQLCRLLAGGGYDVPSRSPDRADALVWALSELMLGRRATPQVRWV